MTFLNLWYLYDEPLPNQYAASIQLLRTGDQFGRSGDRFVWLAGRLTEPCNTCLARYGLRARRDFEVRAFFPRNPLPNRLRWWFIRRRIGLLLQELRQRRGDHILMTRGATGFDTLPYARRSLEGLQANVRLVYEMHRLLFLKAAETEAGRSVSLEAPLSVSAQKIFEIERRVIDAADALVFVSEGIKDASSQVFPHEKPTLVLPSGVDLPVAREERKTYDVVYAGKLDKRKGVLTLVSAMRYLPDRTLGLAGGDERQISEVRCHAEFEGVAGRVHVTAWMDPAVVGAFLGGGRVGVCPIPEGIDSVSDRFTSPMKLLQLMSLGMPIVATDVPPVRNVICDGEEALLVPPNDPAALAAAIAKLLSNPALAARLSSAARRKAQTYAWPQRAAHLREFLIEVARGTAGQSQKA